VFGIAPQTPAVLLKSHLSLNDAPLEVMELTQLLLLLPEVMELLLLA
jgi:hypothetical protein